MLPELAPYIPIVFSLTTLLSLLLFYLALRRSNSSSSTINLTLLLFIAWLALQAVLTKHHFYSQDTLSMPPKFLVLIFPPLLLILALFFSSKGRAFIDGLPLKELTYLNVVRVPVEMVLYWLFLSKAIPEVMTFAGRNFDILAGITAPIVAYLAFRGGKPKNQVLLVWNIIALALLINIVGHAALSLPTPFQQMAFDQPNIAVLHFPFSWLPGFIVPLVLFGHLVSIRQVLQERKRA